ncbi:hypothetical protein Pcinc_026498 [Petrolisthes cinctipes]|uniref:Uncharacterized protein n=1 Tax=Petrolisthes cinctipes TaxID=88211 RepID=A0AAE1KA80_PETCI|nr:hypothetical protein Pcinc_026498 [Petrolisthes cinctipes]
MSLFTNSSYPHCHTYTNLANTYHSHYQYYYPLPTSLTHIRIPAIFTNTFSISLPILPLLTNTCLNPLPLLTNNTCLNPLPLLTNNTCLNPLPLLTNNTCLNPLPLLTNTCLNPLPLLTNNTCLNPLANPYTYTIFATHTIIHPCHLLYTLANTCHPVLTSSANSSFLLTVTPMRG